MKCMILMTSYNGIKFIDKQIESIVNQTFKGWNLIIRDDGSKDGTVDAIKQYCQKDTRIRLIENTLKEHGAYLNFWTLIHEVRKKGNDYDYYLFADQDDIWEKDKLDTMVQAGETFDSLTPLLLYSDMRIIDQNDSEVYKSLNSIMGIGEMSGYSLFFTHGFLWGCDICVNKILFNNIPLLPLNHTHIEIMSHDNYIGKYAILKGNVKYIDKVLLSHRRHNDNTTGEYAMKLSPYKIFKRGFLQYKNLSKIHARVYSQSLIMLEMLRQQENSLPKVANKIEKAIEVGGLRMVRTMFELGVKRKQVSRTIGIYTIALMCGYKEYLINYRDILNNK